MTDSRRGLLHMALESLTVDLDPHAGDLCLALDIDSGPANRAGRSSYVDEDGALHFTIQFDRRDDDDDR